MSTFPKIRSSIVRNVFLDSIDDNIDTSRFDEPRSVESVRTALMNDIELQKRDFLLHVGTPHDGPIPHSGRYPHGSGEHPYQHEEWFRGFGEDAGNYFKKYNGKFNDCYNDLKKQGMTDSQIANMLGITPKVLKARVSMSKQQWMDYYRAEVVKIANAEPNMKSKDIADIFGVSKESIQKILQQERAGLTRRSKTMELVDQLRDRVDEHGYVDVSEGNNYWLNTTKSGLDTAATILGEEGYALEKIRVKQAFGDNSTTVNVLAKPGTTAKDIQNNIDKVVPVFDPEINEEATLMGLEHSPVSIDSKRIAVLYAEEGGALKDGLIGVRRGVADLDLGKSNIAQVRIAVDGTHYIKGVAAYDDDNIPPGKDLIVYSNKALGTPLTSSDPSAKTVLKPMKRDENGEIDASNPFGAQIKAKVGQAFYEDANGEQKLSAINKVNEEGDWAGWSGKDYISSQMLSKQPISIAVKQLDLAVDKRSAELDNIMKVTNPAIRKKLLEDYADACDSAAVDLEGAAFPRQQTHLLMPLLSVKDNEVYAPNYKDGEHVILIRFPHQNVHEIPYLTVNNNLQEGDKLIGKNSKDAIGISAKTAAQLSGADYDGDTALVIPADGINFRYDKPLKSLVDFDNKKEYPYREGMHVMTKRERGIEMGLVTNLITDMTAQGCNDTDQLVRAIKHSMVVIDAEKHKLDYQKSYVDNKIGDLYKEWQGKARGGAKTLISKASGQAFVPERKEGKMILDKATGKMVFRKIDPETGEKLFTETGRVREAYTDKNGKYHPEKQITQKTTKMMKALTTGDHDARSISSGTPMEEVYARYANQCHSLGNKARKATLGITIPSGVNPSASKAYAKEVSDITAKIAKSEKHSPLERQALMLYNSMMRSYDKAHPNMRNEDPDKYKKVKSQYMAGARNRFGGGREKMTLTDREWEAIDAGAVGKTMLDKVIRYVDSRDLKAHVMPKGSNSINDVMKARIKNYASMDYTNAQIADALNVSVSAVQNVLSGKV